MARRADRRDLPQRLWATTGLETPVVEWFRDFGDLRNGIQHFAPPAGRDVSADTHRFVFEVLDPFISNCWGLYAIDYDEDHEPYLYFAGALARQEIPFLVSPAAAHTFEDWDVDWDAVSESYQEEMHRRVQMAAAG